MNIPPGSAWQAIRGISHSFSSIRIRRSALAPFIQTSIWVAVPCFIISIFLHGWCKNALIAIGAIVILNFIVASQKFLFKDPNRLHTEEYLERRRALDIAESKGKGPEILTEDSQNLVAPPTVKKTLPLTDDIGKGDSTNV